MGRVRAVGLGDERHEAEAPGPHLAAELLVAPAVLVEHETARLGGDGMAGADDAVEDVEVAAARKGISGVERLVEAADLLHRRAPDRHVAARPDASRAAGVVWVARVRRLVAELLEA